MANVQNQINANAAAQREYELRQTEMTLKYMPHAPEIQMQRPTTYRVYDSFGRSQGYIQQNNGMWQY